MLTAPGSTLTDDTLTDQTPTDESLTDQALTNKSLTGSDGIAGNDLPSGEAVLPCWSAEPDLWFAESPADVEAAKALCVPCPLREACLAGALERREPWGVWGGQLLVAGVVVARKRPRGRPRKTDLAA